MEGNEPENRDTNSGGAQPSYPEPSRSAYTSYSVLSNSTYPVFPGSSITPQGSINGITPLPTPLSGPSTFLHSHISTDSNGETHQPYGAWPRSPFASTPPGLELNGTSNGFGNHAMNVGGFRPAAGGTRTQSSFSVHDTASSEQLTEVQRLAKQFHVRHGDPGSRSTPHQWPLPPVDGAVSRSALAGIWQDDVGGKAAARRAWQSAVTYGGQYEYDESPDEARADPELEILFAQADASQQRSGPQKKLGKGRGGWRKLLKGTEHEKVGKSRGSAGRGRGTQRGRGRRAPKAVDPGREFKKFLQIASKAFVDGNLEEAVDNARQAIQANPEVFQAHSLLSQILKNLGRNEDAIEAILYGANTSRDSEVWLTTADRILEIAGERRDKLRLKQAVDCYNHALKLPDVRNNTELETEIAIRALDICEELDDARNARSYCKRILKHYPSKTEYVRRFAVLCAQMQDTTELQTAKRFYENAFDIYKDDDEFGDEDDPTDSWSHLNIYLELYDMDGSPADGAFAGKRLARWFLGRKDESFWDKYIQDDREFDDDNSRRNMVLEFQQGRASMDRERYGEGLPIDIRVRLGLLRLKMGLTFHDEALRHFRPLLNYVDSIEEYYDMFLQVAGALRNSGYVRNAAEFYDPVWNVPNADHPILGLGEKVWMHLGTCYQVLSRHNDAVISFENVCKRRGENYTKACARLAKLYEDSGQTEKARQLCSEVIMLNRRDLLYAAEVKMVPVVTKAASKPIPKAPGDTTTALRGPKPRGSGEAANAAKRKRDRQSILSDICADAEDAPEDDNDKDGSGVKRPRLKRKYVHKNKVCNLERIRQLQDAEQRSHGSFAIVQGLRSTMKEGKDPEVVEQWMEAAYSLLSEFTAMKTFFPERDRHLKAPAVYTNSKQFLSLYFRDWHKVFVDLAMIYVKTGEQDRCYKIVHEVLFGANVFTEDQELVQISYAVGIHCGLAFNDSQYLIQLARQILTDNNFRNGAPFQLLAALNRFPVGSNWFNSGPSQKWMLRMVKQNDYMAMNEEVRSKIDWSAQAPSLEQRANKYPAEKTPDAHALMMYGHMVAVANHSHSALPYYYRALALQPDNICTHLSIAAMWVQNSMKRQTANRQFGITQGLSFIYRYYDLRVASGKAGHIQEAEYNVARMWHYIGLTHLAIPAYEKVLKLSTAVQAERLEGSEDLLVDVENFAPEAAYALQGIYSLVGNSKSAKDITEAWLVI